MKVLEYVIDYYDKDASLLRDEVWVQMQLLVETKGKWPWSKKVYNTVKIYKTRLGSYFRYKDTGKICESNVDLAAGGFFHLFLAGESMK